MQIARFVPSEVNEKTPGGGSNSWRLASAQMARCILDQVRLDLFGRARIHQAAAGPR